MTSNETRILDYNNVMDNGNNNSTMSMTSIILNGGVNDKNRVGIIMGKYTHFDFIFSNI